MSTIDILASNNGLTEKSPSIKMAVGILLLIASLVFDNYLVQVLIIVTVFIVLTMIGRIRGGSLVALYRIPLFFLTISSAVMIVRIGNYREFETLIALGNIGIGIDGAGILAAKSAVFRSLAAISSTYFIALSTPVYQQIKVLKKLRIPEVIIEQMLLIYRFISVFMVNLTDMRVGMELKCGFTGMFSYIKNASTLADNLFYGIMSSMDDWRIALELKLYNGRFY